MLAKNIKYQVSFNGWRVKAGWSAGLRTTIIHLITGFFVPPASWSHSLPQHMMMISILGSNKDAKCPLKVHLGLAPT